MRNWNCASLIRHVQYKHLTEATGKNAFDKTKLPAQWAEYQTAQYKRMSPLKGYKK